MFWTLVRKEILSHLLSLRFGVTFILFILLVFASIYVTTNEYERDLVQYAAGERAARSHLAEIVKEEDGRTRIRRLIDWEGRMDAVPVPSLSSLVQGLRPFTPIALNTTEDYSRNIGRGTEKNPLAGLLRIPDLVYVVSVVLSLLAILFAFDSICGEKEDGTLRLILSNAVPRDAILRAKWLGGYLLLIVPFLIAAVGGFGYAWWRGSLELEAGNLQRLAALLFVACLYISVFFTLSLFISTLTHRSVTALFACLLTWVVWILVIPNLAPVIAKIVSPAPSVEKISAEKRAVDREIRIRIERLTLTSGELNYGRKIQRDRERLVDEGRRLKRRWDRFLTESTKSQTNLAETLGRISPSVCWTYAAVALADTGPGYYRRFEQGRKRLEQDMDKFGIQLRETRNRTGEWPPIAAEEVPRLQIAGGSLRTAFESALNDVLILSILNVVLFMSAFVFFLRYDVR